MSKRKSQTAMTAYREQGYLPEAMVNFLAFLGWSPGTEEEIFTLEELAARFEIGKVHRAGAIFDAERLDHLNGLYIRALTDEQLALRLRPFVPDALDDASLLRVGAAHQGAASCASADATELLAFLVETDAEVDGPLRRRRARAEEGGRGGDRRCARPRTRRARGARSRPTSAPT